jgi:hypothetical protein
VGPLPRHRSRCQVAPGLTRYVCYEEADPRARPSQSLRNMLPDRLDPPMALPRPLPQQISQETNGMCQAHG